MYVCVCTIYNFVYRGNYQKNQLKELKAGNSKESKIRRGFLLFVMNFFEQFVKLSPYRTIIIFLNR